MLKKQEYGGLTWIDLERPSETEIAQMVADYGIHPLIAEELKMPSARSKVDRYSDFIYLILHFPVCSICYGQSPPEDEGTEEIDFVLGRDFILTVHYQTVAELSEFINVFNINHLKQYSREIKPHAGHIFFYLLKHLYGNLSSGLDYVNNVLKKAERKIFSGQEKEMVKLLASIDRTLLDFRWSLKAHRQLLDSLVDIGAEFYGGHFRYYLTATVGEYEKVRTMLENNRETFLDLRRTNDSLLSIKTNETVKSLTVLAFILLPLTIVTQFFGMNTNLPLIGPPGDYLAVIGLMAFLTAVMFAWVKYRRWL